MLGCSVTVLVMVHLITGDLLEITVIDEALKETFFMLVEVMTG